MGSNFEFVNPQFFLVVPPTSGARVMVFMEAETANGFIENIKCQRFQIWQKLVGTIKTIAFRASSFGAFGFDYCNGATTHR